MVITVENLDVLIVAILVLYLGRILTGKIQFLDTYNIPPAVTGGIIFSLLVALIQIGWDIQIIFDMQLRDLFLLFFFSTIGLGAKFNVLAAGGKTLAILTAIAAVLLVLQNVTGVGLAMLFGAHPGYGLLGGSISFAGGHGTAIAWGQLAAEAGLKGAEEFGVAAATFGLIAGGVIGGPIGGWLIRKHKLQPSADVVESYNESETAASSKSTHVEDILGTLLVLAVCVTAGDLVNRYLSTQGFSLPGFLTAMMVGILITNLTDVFGKSLSTATINTTGEVSLHLFLAMSLMSMQLLSLAASAGPILVLVLAQTVVITLVAVYLVFRITGSNYDSAVMASGFSGLGMGATPVAIANITAITGKFGPSPKAFLVIPLIGAFFIDLLNAVIVKAFLATPFFIVN
ncbi:MAG: sodium/glutamate symporter [Gammaproteobacteria bacterium]|nr:MAG: sodium/glutamate symporter [Gammaproteobacteria bacterium]